MRVYELAKEFDVKSIDLVDKIRKDWKLPVRSYMEVLNKEVEKEIRKRLKEEQTQKSKVQKKSVKKDAVVRKKAAQKSPVLKKSQAQALKKEPAEPSPAPRRQSIIRRKAVDVKAMAQKEKAVEIPPPISKEEEVLKTQKTPTSLKEELRSLTTQTPDLAVEEEKRKFKKTTEQAVKKFRASDFRKREVIFQPKKKRGVGVASVKKTQITKPKSHKRVIKFFRPLLASELSHQMGIKLEALLKKLKSENLSVSGDQPLDFDTVSLVAGVFGFEVKNQEKTFEEIVQELEFGNLKVKSIPCPPVVTVMGHVDHGKTTLLDQLRKSRVVEQEAGGITQHIGAYSVPIGKSFITFIDTPGHEAFTAMRARGAKLTNIVVIVVAADDGVKRQTIEAIEHAQLVKVPIIVAVNKIDKPSADIEKVKKQMSEHNLLPEEWGGETIFVPISALKEKGLKELLEQISLVAEMQEIKANPQRSAKAVVLESRKVVGRGWVASLIVQDGTLKKSDDILSPSLLGRVRQMMNDQGKIISEAGPGQAVEISGFDDAPQAGDTFFAVKDDKRAREFLSQKKQKEDPPESLDKKSMEELLQIHSKKTKELNIIIKADVTGSLEAIKNSLSKIVSDEIKLNIIHSGLGGVNESDILMAATAQAEVVAFNVRPDSKSSKASKEYQVPIWTYTVIYDLIDGVRKRVIGILDPNIVDEVCGKAEIREVFSISGVGAIAGSLVLSGKIYRQNLARLIRDGRIIFDGKIQSLRRFKEDVKEVGEKYECGIGIENYNDLKVGDIIEAYSKKEIARTEL